MSIKSLALISVALLGVAGAAAVAEPMDHAEAEMFRSAKVSLQQASDTAVRAHAGSLAGIVFNDEDGRGVYEATVVEEGGAPWTVKIDANTGVVLASGLTSMMQGDHPDHRNGHGHDRGDGEDDD